VTTLRLAVGHNANMMRQGFRPDYKPYAAMLCSYFYLWKFDMIRGESPGIAMRDWSMDSGAFTAWAQGEKIDLEAYTRTCVERFRADPALVEVFVLDAIDDPEQTLANVEWMWKHGVPAIPVYHYGEPEKYLLHYAQHYPKLALGGVASLRGGDRHKWMRQCFARVWPALVHGFAVTAETDLLCVPWDSVDSSSWQGPAQYGLSKAFNVNSGGNVRGRKAKMRSSYRALARPEVDWYLNLELKAKGRHRGALEEAMRATLQRFPDYPYRAIEVAS